MVRDPEEGFCQGKVCFSKSDRPLITIVTTEKLYFLLILSLENVRTLMSYDGEIPFCIANQAM